MDMKTSPLTVAGVVVTAVVCLLALSGWSAGGGAMKAPGNETTQAGDHGPGSEPQPGARVLRVGSWNGIPGQYKTIAAAVKAARPGDWILIGPGDWHPSMDGGKAGVYITTPDLHLRGMDRNTVIIDGTRPGAAQPCSHAPAAQNLGPADGNWGHTGRNGIWVRLASGVSVENLTVCNFLTGSGWDTGNQVFFDGDARTPIGLHAWRGAWLSTTDTFYGTGSNPPRGSYGLFTSSADGPGLFSHAYASNMADSGFYIGACRDCNAVIDHVHAQNNALGYSGTNSGGHLVIENSEWDHNKTGLSTNSQSVGDPPPPQNGACPDDESGPTGTGNCWILIDNNIHDNNVANVPEAGYASEGPVGTGVVLAGAHNDIVKGNRIVDNGSWGVLLTLFFDKPVPATGSPQPTGGDQKQPDCTGGTNVPHVHCIFNPTGNEVTGNVFSGNGFFGNPSNVDMAEISNPADPGNCWHSNRRADGSQPSSDPALIQSTHGICGLPNSGEPLSSMLGLQVLCATQALGGCRLPPDQANYPRQTRVALMPLKAQPSMPDPCKGVPNNPWCHPGRKPARAPTSTSGDTDKVDVTGSGGLVARTGDLGWWSVPGTGTNVPGGT